MQNTIQLNIQQISSNLRQERGHAILLMKYKKSHKDLLTCCTLSPYFHVFITQTRNNLLLPWNRSKACWGDGNILRLQVWVRLCSLESMLCDYFQWLASLTVWLRNNDGMKSLQLSLSSLEIQNVLSGTKSQESDETNAIFLSIVTEG